MFIWTIYLNLNKKTLEVATKTSKFLKFSTAETTLI